MRRYRNRAVARARAQTHTHTHTQRDLCMTINNDGTRGKYYLGIKGLLHERGPPLAARVLLSPHYPPGMCCPVQTKRDLPCANQEGPAQREGEGGRCAACANQQGTMHAAAQSRIPVQNFLVSKIGSPSILGDCGRLCTTRQQDIVCTEFPGFNVGFQYF